MLPVWYYPKIDSTMNVIKYIPQECAVIALEQTDGRGKPGSVWESNKGNFLCSLKVYNHFNFNQCQLSVFFGLVIGFAIDMYKEDLVEYKYPNDVYVRGYKVGGVLIEFQENFILVGLGVNLVSSPKYATNLMEYGLSISVREFMKSVQQAYEKLLYLHMQKGWKYLENCWESNLLER